MLDENLPTFFLKRDPDKSIKHIESFLFTQHGSEPDPTYSLRHLDPASNEAKNTYAAALFDIHTPEILYGEVFAKPGWEQPTLSQDEINRNGGIPPPPRPILPTEFAIQLYNPDQQVIVRQVTAKWTGSISYEFSMPQESFRMPSGSDLDRSRIDPAADTNTPKINFVWRKEGRLGKDMTCYLTGKSTDSTSKRKKSKEPDITIAMFTGMKELTLYEPHLNRVEMEDYKGLEVVLLLGAAVIRDLFLNPKDPFHFGDSFTRKNSGGIRGRKGSSPVSPSVITPPVLTPQPQPPAAVNSLYAQPPRNDARRQTLPPLQTASAARPQDPRTQWEIEAETARLKAQVEAEERERKRQEELARRRRLKMEEEEARKTKKLLEAEEKERKRRQAIVDQETERLKRQFGDQRGLLPPAAAPQRHSAPLLQRPFQQAYRPPGPAYPTRPRPANQGPYLQPVSENGPAASSTSFFSSGTLRPQASTPKLKTSKKKSFFGLRTVSESQASGNTLRKKQSSMF